MDPVAPRENATTVAATPPTLSSPTSAPTPTPPAVPALQAQPQTQDQTFQQQLDAGEEHWKWKLSMRFLLLAFALIGTGCLGWATQASNSGMYYWLVDSQSVLWIPLITFAITIAWTLVCILVLLLRRPTRPVHPGVAVGMDLILWLAYIFTIFIAAYATVSMLHFAENGIIDLNYSSGYYKQASNGTWLYTSTSTRSSRDCDSTATSSYYNSYNTAYFANCTEFDAWVNDVAKAAPHRASVVTMGAVSQGICLLLHFILFVWACVDTNRRNRRKTSGDAEKLAAEIIGRMVRDGAIVQAPGQAAAPAWRYQQLPGQNQQQGYQQQWYQGQPMYTVHQGPPPPLSMMHPALRDQVAPGPAISQIVEHYGDVKVPRRNDGAGPMTPTRAPAPAPVPMPTPTPTSTQPPVVEQLNEKAPVVQST